MADSTFQELASGHSGEVRTVLESHDVEPFLEHLATRFNKSTDVFARAEALLRSNSPGTFSAQEVIDAAILEHRGAVLKATYASQMTRCIR